MIKKGRHSHSGTLGSLDKKTTWSKHTPLESGVPSCRRKAKGLTQRREKEQLVANKGLAKSPTRKKGKEVYP